MAWRTLGCYPATEALPTPTSAHPHDIPVYGAAYSKPGHAHGQSHYHEHQHQNPYAHIAANTSSQSLHDYSAYAPHSVPDGRSELWSVNVNPPPTAEYPAQPTSGYDAHTHTHAQGQGQAHRDAGRARGDSKSSVKSQLQQFDEEIVAMARPDFDLLLDNFEM